MNFDFHACARRHRIREIPNYRQHGPSSNLKDMNDCTPNQKHTDGESVRFQEVADRVRKLLHHAGSARRSGDIEEHRSLLRRLADELAEAAALDC